MRISSTRRRPQLPGDDADGVPLAVREVGPTDVPLTVVFADEFCLRMGAFHFQRMRLSEEWGTGGTDDFYDQRGHGRSGEAPPETYPWRAGQGPRAVCR